MEQGKTLNWLFELRGVGDYGGIAHVSPEAMEQAIDAADKFLIAIRSLLNADES
jgi:hypothetical protein